MGEEKPFEPVRKIRPGDEVIRRRVKPRRRLRVSPRVPEAIRFIKVMITQTPLIPMLSITAVLWILFSLGLYFAEYGTNEHVSSFGQALWWGLASVETMGTPYKPVTLAGQVVGGIWAILGVVLFLGNDNRQRNYLYCEAQTTDGETDYRDHRGQPGAVREAVGGRTGDT